MLKVFDFELVGVVLLFEEEEVLEEVFDLLWSWCLMFGKEERKAFLSAMSAWSIYWSDQIFMDADETFVIPLVDSDGILEPISFVSLIGCIAKFLFGFLFILFDIPFKWTLHLICILLVIIDESLWV